MTELRRTIDEIRFLLQDDAFAVSDQLMQCAADYSALCHEANVRLRKCEEFLNQGHRSEALHLAEIAPNLLDLVAMLDFPEREQWVNLLIGYSLPKPEPLLLTVASILNEAYAAQQPLERLLDQHRLYALARSPLTQRLSVLRSIAEIDTSSSHWEADIRAMERARFREIESESRAAIAAGEVESLKELVSELNGRSWLEAVPGNLLRDVKQKGGSVVRGQAREQLEMLVVTLHDAQASLNLPLARQMRDAWLVNAKIVQLAEHDELAEQAAPVLEWIEDEDRKEAAEKVYRRAVIELEQALEQNQLNSIELQQFGQAVEKCGRGIPEALRLRYRHRLGNLDLGESRRNLAKIGALGGGVLAVVVVICVAVYFSNEAEKSRRILVAVGELIDKQQLGEAHKLLNEHPQRALTAEGLALKSKLAAATQAEHDRQSNLTAAVERAKAANDLAATAAALQQARELARTADEKITVGKLEADWKSRHDADIAQTEQRFRSTLAATTANLRTLDGLLNVPESEADVRKLCDQVQTELAQLRAAESKVAAELVSQATLLESRFGGFRKIFMETVKKNVLLDKLAVLVQVGPLASPADSQISDYRDLIAQFVTAFPNDPRVPGFKGAGNVEVMKSVAARQQLAIKWQQLWPPDSVELKSRQNNCDAFLKEFTSSPDRSSIQQYLAFLKSLEWRLKVDEDSENSVQEQLQSLFSGKLIKDGHLLRDKDHKEYYLEKAKDISDQKTPFTLSFIVGFNGELKTIKEMKSEQFEPPKTASPPQKVLADFVHETAGRTDPDQWDAYLHDLANKLVQATEVNSFLRYFLLLRTLEYASEGNSVLAAELKKSLSDLNDKPPDMSVSWMDPTNIAAKNSHARAGTLVKRISVETLDAAWKRAAAAQSKLSADLFRQTLPIGWLERTADRRWILRTKWVSEKKHSLLVSVAAEDGAQTWQPIGGVQAGVTDLTLPTTGTMAEGTVVFATPIAGKGP